MKNPIGNMKTAVCFAGCLSLLVPAVPVQAQQNQSLELAFDSQVVYGGNPNQTGPAIAANQPYNVGLGIAVQNPGNATVACYDNQAQFFLQTFYSSQQPYVFSHQFAAGQHSVYCSGNFSGNYFNGTVTTGAITFQAN